MLITGASGMLGATLVNFFLKDYNVFGTGATDFENTDFNYMKFDLASDSYEDLITWSKPNIIIHCGALTNGNYCEENPTKAFNVNGVSVQKFLKATISNVKIIYISTDAVFPSKLNLAKESDCVYPENVYGKSKELGEFFLKTFGPSSMLHVSASFNSFFIFFKTLTVHSNVPLLSPKQSTFLFGLLILGTDATPRQLGLA